MNTPIVICPKCEAQLYKVVQPIVRGARMQVGQLEPFDDTVPEVTIGTSPICPKCGRGLWLTKSRQLLTKDGLIP